MPFASEYPWLAFVGVVANQTVAGVTTAVRYDCTGTLIAPTTVLCAGHCVAPSVATDQFGRRVTTSAAIAIRVELGAPPSAARGCAPAAGPGPRVPGRPPHRALARPTPAARRRPAGFRWAQLQPQGGAGSAPSRGYLPSEVWTAASYTLHPQFWDLTGEGGTIGNDISLISLPAPSFFPPAAMDLGGRFGANLEAMAVGWGERFSTSPAAGLLSTSTSTSENNASTRRGAQGFRVSRLTAPRMRWRRRRSLSPQTRRQPGAARTCTATTGTEGTR